MVFGSIRNADYNSKVEAKHVASVDLVPCLQGNSQNLVPLEMDPPQKDCCLGLERFHSFPGPVAHYVSTPSDARFVDAEVHLKSQKAN